jgi:hypothetical protein
LKEERKQEEFRMENEFRQKMMEKFAEDDRIEQMNAQKRRLKEQEHKREVENLWQDKLSLYREMREQEIQEKQAKEEEERYQQWVIEQEKERLLKEHGNILTTYHPKAASTYGQFGRP